MRRLRSIPAGQRGREELSSLDTRIMTEQSAPTIPQRFFSAPLSETDPALAAVLRARAGAPAGRHRADRQREHRLRRGDGGAGLGADQQIRRGLPGPPLLRRLRRGGRGRAARHRPGEADVRLRLRQRAAALRRAGQPGGVPGDDQARRHHPRHEPGRRWAPDAWRGAQPVRQVVPRRAVWRAARGRPAGLRGAGAPGPRRAADADHRRWQRLPARDRLCPHPRGGGRGGRVVPGGHGALRRAGGGRAVPLALPARPDGDHHHAQDAARPARRHDPDQ